MSVPLILSPGLPFCFITCLALLRETGVLKGMEVQHFSMFDVWNWASRLRSFNIISFLCPHKWGTKPVLIPFVFMWPTLLFTKSVRLFIWSTFCFLYDQLEFLCGQLFLLIRSIFIFYMVNSSFCMVNFLFFISVSVKADCRFQTADRRPQTGIKCRLRVKCWL